MQIGMVGLGRMGANLARRLMADGHECVVYDIDAEAVKGLHEEGAVGVTTLSDFAKALTVPRVAWIMVPAGVTRTTIDAVVEHFEPGDTVIDGGNSMWQDDVDTAADLSTQRIHHVDIGTSGGVHGLERGYSLMIGGEDDIVARLEPIFNTIAPGIEAAPRTPGLEGNPHPGEQGWLHCGPNGAGHFVKMVHNGIEYGMMAAIAEGMNVLRQAGAGRAEQEHDAETSPLRSPQYYQYNFDTAAIAEVWRRGTVISSWLGDLTAKAMAADPDLDAFGGRVSDSGEGRWTVQAAVDLGVPSSTITASLYQRFASRGNDVFAGKVLSAMRAEFGGHAEKPAEEATDEPSTDQAPS